MSDQTADYPTLTSVLDNEMPALVIAAMVDGLGEGSNILCAGYTFTVKRNMTERKYQVMILN